MGPLGPVDDVGGVRLSLPHGMGDVRSSVVYRHGRVHGPHGWCRLPVMVPKSLTLGTVSHACYSQGNKHWTLGVSKVEPFP